MEKINLNNKEEDQQKPIAKDIENSHWFLERPVNRVVLMGAMFWTLSVAVLFNLIGDENSGIETPVLVDCIRSAQRMNELRLEMLEDLSKFPLTRYPTMRFCKEIMEYRKIRKKVLEPEGYCRDLKLNQEEEIDLMHGLEWEKIRRHYKLMVLDAATLPLEFDVRGRSCSDLIEDKEVEL